MKKRTLLLIFGLVFQIIQLYKNKSKALKKLRILNILTNLTPASPSEIINKFQKTSEYSLCKGKIFGSQKCTSIIQPQKSVIFSKLFQRKNFQVRQQLQTINKLVKTARPSHLTVNDGFSSIPLYQTMNLKIQTTGMTQRVNNVNRHSKINFIIDLINIFKDYSIPHIADSHYEEHFFPEGGQAVVLGIFKKQSSGKICCEKPLMLGRNKFSLMYYLDKQLSQLNMEKYLLILGAGLCIGWLLKTAFQNFKQYKKKSLDPIQTYTKIQVKSRVCCQCHNNISNMVFQKCGHLNLCKECFDKQQGVNICQQCKKKNDQSLELYVC